MKSKKLEIEIPEGKTAVWRNGILTLIDEPEKDVRKRIKTFEDACREIGIDAEAWNRDKISLGLVVKSACSTKIWLFGAVPPLLGVSSCSSLVWQEAKNNKKNKERYVPVCFMNQ